MPYEVDLTVEDTTSLLGLVNSSNPVTIGEPLTFATTDIANFVKNVLIPSGSDDLILIEKYPERSLHLYGTMEEAVADLGANIAVLNAAVATPGPIANQSVGNELMSKWKAGAITYHTTSNISTLPAAGPWGIDTEGWVRPPSVYVGDYQSYNLISPVGVVPTADGVGTTIEIDLKFTSFVERAGQYGFGFIAPDGRGLLYILRTGTTGVGVLYVIVGGWSIGSAPVTIPLNTIGKLKVVLTSVGLNTYFNNVLIHSTTFAINTTVAEYLQGKAVRAYIMHSGAANVNIRPTIVSGLAPINGWAGVVNAGTVNDPINVKVATVSEAKLINVDTTSATPHGTAVEFGDMSQVTLINRSYLPDTVDVKFRRLAVTDLITLSPANAAWSWYNSSEWLQSRDIPLAIQMFKDTLLLAGIDSDKILRNLNVTRTLVESDWYLNFTFDSYVLKDLEFSKFKMPSNFSDHVTATSLNGFIYTAIAPANVVV